MIQDMGLQMNFSFSFRTNNYNIDYERDIPSLGIDLTLIRLEQHAYKD